MKKAELDILESGYGSQRGSLCSRPGRRLGRPGRGFQSWQIGEGGVGDVLDVRFKSSYRFPTASTAGRQERLTSGVKCV